MGGLVLRVRWMAITIVGAALLVLVMPSTAYAAVLHAADFAGYSGNVSGAPTTFVGSLTIPTVTNPCPATGPTTVEPVVNLGVSSGYTIGFSAQIVCLSSSNWQWYFNGSVLPAGGSFSNGTGFPVSPGDVVKMSAKISGAPSKVVVSISDLASLYSGQVTEPMTGSFADIFAATSVSGFTSPLVVPSFTPIKFSGMKLGGLPLGGFGLQEYKMYNGSTLQVSTSSMSSIGASFSNTFVHS